MAINQKSTTVVVDDGTKEYTVENKYGKLICKMYLRPADFSILDRYKAFVQDFDSIVEPLSKIDVNADGTAVFEAELATLKEAENEIKQRFNMLFDIEEADEIFAQRSPFSSIGGRFFCEIVLEALSQIIEEAIKEETEKTEKRVAKYLSEDAQKNGKRLKG